MPAHCPGANWVSPRNWTQPALFPFTHTRSPTLNSSAVSWFSDDALSPGTALAAANQMKDKKKKKETILNLAEWARIHFKEFF